MKQTFTHTVGVELPRNMFSREQIKNMDKIYSTHQNVKPYYTGLVGRRMCFAFPDEETKIEFMKAFKAAFSNIQKKTN